MAIKSSAIADLEAFPGKDVYKRYFYLAGEVFHLAEKFFTWQRNFSPGRRSFSPGREVSHLAGEVARWILSQGARDMNWPSASTIVWPASTLLPIAITDPARPPAVAVVYTCGLQSPISATTLLAHLQSPISATKLLAHPDHSLLTNSSSRPAWSLSTPHCSREH